MTCEIVVFSLLPPDVSAHSLACPLESGSACETESSLLYSDKGGCGIARTCAELRLIKQVMWDVPAFQYPP